MDKKILENIFESQQTVFGANEIALLLGESNRDNLKARLHYLVKRGFLLNLRRGIYAKNEAYNRFELARKIYKPSYVSLDTILARNGVIFQYDSRIFSVSYLSRELEVDGQNFVYRKIKDEVLFAKDGIVFADNYWQASLERAFLDKIYLNPDFYFDNLSKIDWKKVNKLAKLYGSKRLLDNLRNYQNVE